MSGLFILGRMLVNTNNLAHSRAIELSIEKKQNELFEMQKNGVKQQICHAHLEELWALKRMLEKSRGKK